MAGLSEHAAEVARADRGIVPHVDVLRSHDEDIASVPPYETVVLTDYEAIVTMNPEALVIIAEDGGSEHLMGLSRPIPI